MKQSIYAALYRQFKGFFKYSFFSMQFIPFALTSELKSTEQWGRGFDSSEIKMTGVITEIQVLLVLRPNDSIAGKVAFYSEKDI